MVQPIRDVEDDIAVTFDQDPVEVDVLSNDTCNHSTGTARVTFVTDPSNGSATINSDGTVTYIANEGFYGEDIFDYTVTVTNSDGSSTTEIATVMVTVFLSPFAIDDEAVTDANIPIEIDVLSNDYDEDGTIDLSSVEIVSDPLNGTVDINTDGTMAYTPDFDFIGDDIFEYQICDNDGLCSTAVVTIIVKGVLEGKFNIPQGFSPNGDGVHDVFYINGLSNFYPNFQIQIFNRWGNVVYEYTHNGNPLTEPKWWDGSSSGRGTISRDKQLPVGTYFYVLNLNKGSEKPKTGYIYLNK